MKIISWNINGIRSVAKKGFSDYILSENADIYCLQEVRATPEQIPDELLRIANYQHYWNPCKIKKGYSGVGIYTRHTPVAVIDGIGIEEFDAEGRILGLDFGDFVVFSVYFPNGKLGERLQYKLNFYDAFFTYCADLQKNGKKILISGDYNTAHHAIDLARPAQNTQTSGFLPEEREKLNAIEQQGFTDTFRLFTKEGGHYTWWSNQQMSRERNVGWRIDYHFVTNNLLNNVQRSYHRPDVFGSDHCPIVIELKV
jgi:exodeoxyribonuclease-3